MTDLYRWASAQCARKETCRSEITAKLLAKGMPGDEADALLARLEREGYLDEARYARAYAADKFRFNHWGRVKIRYMLLHKGVSDCDIDTALGEIAEEEYGEALRQFLAARLRATDGGDPTLAGQKAARAAITRGYEPQLVFQALHSL